MRVKLGHRAYCYIDKSYQIVIEEENPKYRIVAEKRDKGLTKVFLRDFLGRRKAERFAEKLERKLKVENSSQI